MNVAARPAELERRPRAVAIGTFDGVHLGHQAVVRAAVEAGPTPTVLTLPPASARGARQPRRAALDARAPAGAARPTLGVEETLVVEFTPEVAALAPEEFARSYLARDRRRARGVRASRSASGTARRRPRRCSSGSASTDTRRADTSRACRRRRSAGCSRRATCAAPRGCSGGPARSRASSSSGDARGGTLGFPTANLRVEQCLLVPRVRHLRGCGARPSRRGLDRRQPALRRRRAARRGVPARLRGRPLRAAARRRAVGAPPRRGGVRERGRARRADRARRRGDARARRALNSSFVRVAGASPVVANAGLAGVRPPRAAKCRSGGSRGRTEGAPPWQVATLRATATRPCASSLRGVAGPSAIHSRGGSMALTKEAKQEATKKFGKTRRTRARPRSRSRC